MGGSICAFRQVIFNCQPNEWYRKEGGEINTVCKHELIRGRATKDLIEAVRARAPIGSLTHPFYLYPARFSPDIARAGIRLFTDPGDLVIDPFVGGGTTLVESAANGRPSFGNDINELAVFVSRAKTTLYRQSDLETVRRWALSLVSETNLRREASRSSSRGTHGPFRNASTRYTWHIRKFFELAVGELPRLRSARQERLARCILLRVGRWALDCKMHVPRVSELRSEVVEFANEMCFGAAKFRSAVEENAVRIASDEIRLEPRCVHASAIGIDRNRVVRKLGTPKLVLCSPPYPGTHVLYHRWQVRGRKETPAPYWIANCTDNQGPSYYTMGGRSEKGMREYFARIRDAFASISRLLDESSVVMQVIAFSKPSSQLPLYLEAMSEAGYEELLLPRRMLASEDGRLWRTVPNRRWYTYRPQIEQDKREIVLFHKLGNAM